MILHFLSSFGPLGLRTILIDSSKTFLRPWKAQKEQFWYVEKKKILELYKTTNLLLLCWTLKVLDAPRVRYFLETSEDLIWANLIEDNWLQLSAQFLALLLGDRSLSFGFQGSNRRLIFSQIHLVQLLSLNPLPKWDLQLVNMNKILRLCCCSSHLGPDQHNRTMRSMVPDLIGEFVKNAPNQEIGKDAKKATKHVGHWHLCDPLGFHVFVAVWRVDRKADEEYILDFKKSLHANTS